MQMRDDEIVIDKDDIIQLLSEIGKKLAKRKQFGSLTICGGAAMALLFNARDLTSDIDSQFRPNENIHDFKSIVDEITQERNLPDNHWCNDDYTMFSDDYCTDLKSKFYRSFDNLDVFIMEPESLLAMKLISARPKSHDRSDSITLMKELKIQSIDELSEIFDRHFVSDKMHPDELRMVKGFVSDTFEDYQKQLSSKKRISI